MSAIALSQDGTLAWSVGKDQAIVCTDLTTCNAFTSARLLTIREAWTNILAGVGGITVMITITIAVLTILTLRIMMLIKTMMMRRIMVMITIMAMIMVTMMMK